MPAQKLQFIHSTTASVADSTAAQRRLARSHAARSTHAKERRLRTIQYQAQKAQKAKKAREANERSTLPTAGYGMDELNPDPNHLLSYHRRDPFASWVRKLGPLEEMLFDHYVTTVVLMMRCNALDVHFARHMTRAWIPLALSEESLLSILFLAASRHLHECYRAQRQAETYNNMAFRYKLQLLRSLREAIDAEAPWFTDMTVMKAIMLAYDELWTNDEMTMKNHVEGAVRMVELKGGAQTLGLDGFIERLLFNLLIKVNMEVRLTVTSEFDPRIASVEIRREMPV
ncbi:hypothetical protein BDW74DRAFT_183226 [Aspergillus multicolor]|uniref:uncharacterized protein n=1 Tax=Aspergillus multicolor TaxID=41759 RepID=UPI003CCE00E2